MIFGYGNESCLVDQPIIAQSHAILKTSEYPESPEVIQAMTGKSSVSDGEIPSMSSVISVFGSFPSWIRR